jgi:aminoglycoside phosphotransferase (APT) family kinase protein
MVSLCEGLEQIGAPFYVMEWVNGFVVHDEAMASPLDAGARRALSEEVVAVLSRLHSIDIDAVGLGRLGRREGYIERQLYRWERQWQDSKADELPLVEEVHARLQRNVPMQQGVALVHGDFGLHNTIVNEEGRVLAVIDWELAALGDPLADLGLLLARWTDPIPGFAAGSELTELYGERSTRDLSALNYYIAFANWKLACIGAGVYARYRGGAMGHSAVTLDGMWADVARRAEIAHDLSIHLR